MVNWDEIKKELKKLTPERALSYLQYLLKTIKDKEILEKIEQEITHLKELIKQNKDWKKTADITPINREIMHQLEDMSRERPVIRELNLEKAVETIEKDLNIKPEQEKGVEYNKPGADYGQYLSERIDTKYEHPNSTFNREQLIQNPERRHMELIEQQRRGHKEPNSNKQEKEEFKYETRADDYKRKRA